MATAEGDASGAMAASPGSRTERTGILHKCRATLERATNLVKSVVMLLTVLACIMIISALTIDSEQTDRQSKMVLFGIGVGCFLQGLAYLIYLVWYTSSGRHSTSITLRPEYVPSVGRRRHVRHRSRDGAREDLPSVRDGGQIQVVVPSPPPYEEVTSQDRRHLGDQNEASTPRPPPYASVAEVDERTTRQQQQQQQSSRNEEPRNSEQCPSYTEAIRSPTSRSPAEEMPSELPPVPPPAYEEVVNR
ncbi:uncharacterized protein LOC144908629 isoform X7 [Branchiostoma floridae x Branchiostoma belcheri]